MMNNRILARSMACFLAFGFLSAEIARCDTETSTTSGDESSVDILLLKFSSTGDIQLLKQSFDLAFLSYTAHNEHEDLSVPRHRRLELKLKVLCACYNARDMTHDLSAAQIKERLRNDLNNSKSQQDRDQIIERYQDSMKKHQRELALQRIQNDAVLYLGAELERISNNPNLNLEDALKTVETVVEDDMLRQLILAPVAQKANGNAHAKEYIKATYATKSMNEKLPRNHGLKSTDTVRQAELNTETSTAKSEEDSKLDSFGNPFCWTIVAIIGLCLLAFISLRTFFMVNSRRMVGKRKQ